MIEAVIFDWDGTLADTKKAVVQAFQVTLVEVGCLVSDRFIERLMGVGTKKTFEEALRKCNIEFYDKELENLVRNKIESQVELFEKVSLFEGAAELLEELHGRTKIGLATMSGRKVIDKLLLVKRIESFFDVVITADDVSKPKPDPEVFVVSAAKLGVNPQDCVVIEDSLFGVRAAKEAKTKCIAVTSGAYSKDELQNENPDFIVAALTEKKKIIHFIFSNSSK
jgi:HAD superfamily hydrolase (TIGR01509 family)